MFNSLKHLLGATVMARDGAIGEVKQAYFDDEAWTIRYLVVNTGSWLSGREVLISPHAVVQPLGSGKLLDVRLSRRQVELSPPVDTHLPVSRQHERDYIGYYALPAYWGGSALWGMEALPLWPPALPQGVESEQDAALRARHTPTEDQHLRSSAEVTGYDIQASDDSIGHVQDFIFDAESWAIRYLVVDTRNWWPGGKKVLLSTRWIDSIDWADREVLTSLTRAQVKQSPAYEPASELLRSDEQCLHDAYDRRGYWL